MRGRQPLTPEGFWARMTTREPGQYWEWTGARRGRDVEKGRQYGHLKLPTGVYIGAHRYAWVLTNGPIPDGLLLMHTCDNTLCCNPAHLRPGTQKDNMADMRAKGRSATGAKNGTYTHPERRATGDRHSSKTHPERVPRGDRHSSKTHPELLRRGEAHQNHKLTDDLVREIRRRAAAGEVQRRIAESMGVPYKRVSKVVRGDIWTHIQPCGAHGDCYDLAVKIGVAS